MKVEIDIDDKYQDTVVKITSPKLTPEVEKMVSLLRMMDSQIPVKKADETYILDTEKILYIEAVERNTFVYTEEEVYESNLQLY